jgi:hypothetical protein
MDLAIRPDPLVAMTAFIRVVAATFSVCPVRAELRPEWLLQQVADALGDVVPEVFGDPLDRLDGAVEALRRLSGVPRWLGYQGAVTGLRDRLATVTTVQITVDSLLTNHKEGTP